MALQGDLKLTRPLLHPLNLISDGSRSSHLWFGFGFGKFPLKIPNFQYLSHRIKKITSVWVKKYWVIYYGSKVCSGRVRAQLYPLLLKSLQKFCPIQEKMIDALRKVSVSVQLFHVPNNLGLAC